MSARKYKNYAEKKEAQKNGSYDGNSPYFTNIPEFQHLKPVESYPHLQQYIKKRKKPIYEDEFEETPFRRRA